jgi:hypothetical protein
MTVFSQRQKISASKALKTSSLDFLSCAEVSALGKKK